MNALLVFAASATPIPTPTMTVPASAVNPGPLGFLAIALLAVVSVLLVIDMQRRIRRSRYRNEINEQLDAEEQGAREAAAAVEASDVDDQDIDPETDAPKSS